MTEDLQARGRRWHLAMITRLIAGLFACSPTTTGASGTFLARPSSAAWTELQSLHSAGAGGGWDGTSDPCTGGQNLAGKSAPWYGVSCWPGATATCPDAKGKIAHLNLFRDPTPADGQPPTALDGQLTDQLEELSCAVSIMLGGNRFSGTLPASLGTLTDLVDLNLMQNAFTGTIPDLHQMGTMSTFNLQFNKLEGYLEPAALPHVSAIAMESNLLSGTIPDFSTSRSDTDNIALSDNHFSGTIPNFSGNRSLLQKLNIIKLDRNNISGTLPTHLCDLGFLDQLFLGGNHIEGTIPNCFAKMMSGISRKSASSGAESSKQLQLTANQLSGTIPGATLHSDGFDRVRPPGEDAPRATVCTLDNFDVGLNIISGTLPKFVGAVQLRLIAAQYNRLSGTLPTEFKGLTSLNLLRLSFNELSGTLDKRFLPLPHEQRVATMPLVNKTCVGTHRRCYFEDLYLDHNHVEGTLPDWLGQMTKLEELGLQTNRLHGTLPSWLGNLHFLRLIYLNSNSFNGSLTGIPMQNWNKNPQCEGDSRPGNPEGCNGDRWYSRLNLYNNSLTGEFPSTLGGINYLTALNLGSNSLTGDLPNAAIRQMERLEKLQLNRNQFTGEVPDVAQLQHLKDLNINSNNFDAWPSGSSYWQQSNLVLMDCANNSLPHLPDPIPPSLTHLFINANPIADDLTALQGLVAPHLHVFDYSFINIPIVLNAETDQCNVQGPEDLTKGCFGPRVITPPGRTCHVGGAPPCQFHLQMYDADDQRLGTTGGLVKGLTFGLNSTITEPLVDNRDGSFTATVPPQWITSNGSQVFSFFHRGVEFIPERNALDETVMYDDDFALLRTVKFIPPDCPDRSRPNAAGAVCVCTEGYKDVHILDSSGSKHLQCERDCPFGTTPSPDHEHCECPSGQYNTKETGVVICAGSEWRDPAGDPGFEEYMDTVRQQLEKPPIYCRPCPRECTVCEHGHATLLEGWRVSGGDQLGRTAEAVVELISNGGSASPLFAFNCPAPLACPEIDMSSITNHTNASTVACLDHTLGPLCAACENGFSRQGSSQCSDCGSHLFETRFGLGPVPFVLVIIAIVIFLAATIGGATKYVLQRNEDLAVSDDGLRVKCNLKIVIGLAQVLPLLSDVLGNVFPTKQPDLHPVKTSMDYLGLAAVEVRSVFELDCWLTYYQSWIMVTFGLPCLVALITGLQFTRNIWLETRHEGSLIAAGTEMSDETESQPETEPEPEAPAQTRCQRWARSHAAADARTWLLFWVLLIYPVLSSNIFRIMQCRTLDDDRAVLERDYRVECSGTEYTAFYWMALVLTALIPFGVPVFVFFLLFLSSHRNLQQFQNGSTAERMSVTQRAQGCVASVCAPFDNPRNPDPHRTTSFVEFNAAKHRDSTLHQTTKNVRDACWWWEPIDLFRKLVLTGLLGFVRRGTVEQVLLGCCCSVFFLTLQSLLQPYRFHGSNVLKLAVECEIFIAFIVSFMLKGRNLHNDAVSEVTLYIFAYGLALFGFMIVLAVVADSVVVLRNGYTSTMGDLGGGGAASPDQQLPRGRTSGNESRPGSPDQQLPRGLMSGSE